jgi:hypothetical protein
MDPLHATIEKLPLGDLLPNVGIVGQMCVKEALGLVASKMSKRPAASFALCLLRQPLVQRREVGYQGSRINVALAGEGF